MMTQKQMTKWTRNGRKRSCKASCLASIFFSICKLLLDKKRKKKKRKIVAIEESFFLFPFQMFFDFRERFSRQTHPKNYYSRKFLSKISRIFDLTKASAPKVMCSYLARIRWGHSTGCSIYSFVIPVISKKTRCSKGFISYLRGIFTWQ